MPSRPEADPTRTVIARLGSAFDDGRARGAEATKLLGELNRELARRFGIETSSRGKRPELDPIDWTRVSPLVFGALSQLASSRDARRASGAHYTAEDEILALLGPLFLHEFEGLLEHAEDEHDLLALGAMLTSFRGLDPAAGCGNFLVIALRELLALEARLLARLRHLPGWSPTKLQTYLDEHHIRLDSFAGIELDEASVAAARLALMATLQRADASLADELELRVARGEPRLLCANALETGWEALLEASGTHYIFGNPPFVGHKYRSARQSAELRQLWGPHYRKLLDYATGWFIQAARYARARGSRTRVAFLATNSLSQGEQVAYLWAPLFDLGIHLDFVHAPFAWRSSTRDAAVVHVMIVGFSHGEGPRELRFASGGLGGYAPVRSLSPYALPGPERVVAKRSQTLSPELSAAVYGSLPADGGGLVVSQAEYPHDDPVAQRYLRPFVGARELMKNTPRWCLWLDEPPSDEDVLASAFLRRRLERVRAFRLASRNADTRALAERPHRFFHRSTASTAFVAFPAQVSQARRWYTPAYLDAKVVPSNSLYWADDPSGLTFAIVSSSMFAAWLDVVGGKLKSDPRFGSAVYNAFPFPALTRESRRVLSHAGLELIRVRGTYPRRSLGQLYDRRDPLPELLDAHARIDALVDAHLHYRDEGENRHTRVRRLLELHQALCEGP